MADDQRHIMTHSFTSPEATTALLATAAPPDRVDECTVKSTISSNKKIAALKRFKRAKAARMDELNNIFKEITQMRSHLFSLQCIPEG